MNCIIGFNRIMILYFLLFIYSCNEKKIGNNGDNIFKPTGLIEDSIDFSFEKYNPEVHRIDTTIKRNNKFFALYVESEKPDTFNVYLNKNLISNNFFPHVQKKIFLKAQEKDSIEILFPNYSSIERKLNTTHGLDSLEVILLSRKDSTYVRFRINSDYAKLYLEHDKAGNWHGEYADYIYLWTE